MGGFSAGEQPSRLPLEAPVKNAPAPVKNPPEFNVHQSRTNATWVVGVSGELDVSRVEQLGQELRRAKESDAERILLDLTGVTFIDSSGIRLLIQATERSREGRDRLRLRPVQGQVRRVLEMTGMLDRLDFTSY